MEKYFIFLLTIQSCLIIKSRSEAVIKRLPGYSQDLPFKLQTGYIGVGEKEDVQLFYYFVESTRNPKEDPLIFYIPGGPGGSALYPFFYGIGPFSINLDDGIDNFKLTINPNSWTQMANIIFVDMLAGSGFSYSETKQGWISSDSILAIQAVAFIKKFLSDHPKFSRNPLYIAGISYSGITVPKITLELYEGNERGDQPTLNIQGYILMSPLTDKFMDFNSRLEYAHRMALVSDDIYQSAIESCHGNYVDMNYTNLVCSNSLQNYEECIRHISFENILDPSCDFNEAKQDCGGDMVKAINIWANTEAVQQALNIRQGKVEKFSLLNGQLHYSQGKKDTYYYSYDMFSSFSHHKKLSGKNCRSLIMSGDHDLTFPYVGVEKWITSLNLQVEIPWKAFYVDRQVGGYETKYAHNDYSLTFSTVKGAGHIIPYNKPRETMVLTQEWFSLQTRSSDFR